MILSILQVTRTACLRQHVYWEVIGHNSWQDTCSDKHSDETKYVSCVRYDVIHFPAYHNWQGKYIFVWSRNTTINVKRCLYNPVSYTHLDVYKRQAVDDLKINFINLTTNNTHTNSQAVKERRKERLNGGGQRCGLMNEKQKWNRRRGG